MSHPTEPTSPAPEATCAQIRERLGWRPVPGRLPTLREHPEGWMLEGPLGAMELFTRRANPSLAGITDPDEALAAIHASLTEAP